MSSIIFHGLIPALWTDLTWTRRFFHGTAVILAAVGGVLPDIVSHVNWLWDWGNWEWYHAAHSFDAVALSFLLSVLVVGIIGDMRNKYDNMDMPNYLWVLMILPLPVSYALHVYMDTWWHKEGGGWVEHAWLLEIGQLVLAVILAFFVWYRNYRRRYPF